LGFSKFKVLSEKREFATLMVRENWLKKMVFLGWVKVRDWVVEEKFDLERRERSFLRGFRRVSFLG
jgi:hypothetical protein